MSLINKNYNGSSWDGAAFFCIVAFCFFDLLYNSLKHIINILTKKNLTAHTYQGEWSLRKEDNTELVINLHMCMYILLPRKALVQ